MAQGKTLIFNPLTYPIYVMAKPIGALCNLDCHYCYYLEKGELYKGFSPKMSDDILERYIKDYIDITTLTNVKIKATAINKDGGILDETIAFGDESASGSTKYNDKIPPVCTKIEGQAKEGGGDSA